MPDISTEANSLTVNRREALISAFLIVTSGTSISWRLRPDPIVLTSNEFESVTPRTVGNYSYMGEDGVVLPLGEDPTSKIYSNFRYGTYITDDQAPVMLLIAYDRAQEYNLQIHRPEGCYPAAGFQLSHRQTIKTDEVLGVPSQATFLTATRAGRTEQILYWTRVGSEFPKDYDQQRYATIKSKFAGKIPDAVLFRISIISTDRDGALKTLLNFATSLARGLSAPAREIYFGKH